ALAQRRSRHEDFEVGLDAPPSVREAIRLAEPLLPAPPALPLPDPPGVRRSAALVVLPLIAVAAALALFGVSRAVRSAAGAAAPAPPRTVVAEPSPPPA